jgi:hypothetical protein
MYGKSLREGFAMSQFEIPDKHQHLALTLLFICFIGLPSTTVARMTDITLPELIKKSEVIVFGHINPSVPTDPQEASAPVPFEVVATLKGSKLLKPSKKVLLCNPHDNSELPDLSKLTGNIVVFVTRTANCFELSHGYVSVVLLTEGRASTYAIKDQPENQPRKSFLNLVRTIISRQSVEP